MLYVLKLSGQGRLSHLLMEKEGLSTYMVTRTAVLCASVLVAVIVMAIK